VEALNKRDRDVLTRIAEGVPDSQVCLDLKISKGQLEQSLARIIARAEAHPDANSAALYYERALRRRAENAARSLEARFHALMEASPNAVLVVNGSTGIIKEVNERAVQMFGYPVSELIGRSMEMLVPDEVRSIHVAYRMGFLASVRRREMGYHPPIVGVRSDGSGIEMAIALTATTADDDVMVVCSEYGHWEASRSEVYREDVAAD
jgi:PAS domain S-box-containing protein